MGGKGGGWGVTFVIDIMIVTFVTFVTFVTLGIHHHTLNARVIRIPGSHLSYLSCLSHLSHEVSTIILGMLESSGFRKYSTPVVFQLFYWRLCLCHCHCLC